MPHKYSNTAVVIDVKVSAAHNKYEFFFFFHLMKTVRHLSNMKARFSWVAAKKIIGNFGRIFSQPFSASKRSNKKYEGHVLFLILSRL